MLSSYPPHLSSASKIPSVKISKGKEKNAKRSEKTLWGMIKGCVSFLILLILLVVSAIPCHSTSMEHLLWFGHCAGYLGILGF